MTSNDPWWAFFFYPVPALVIIGLVALVVWGLA